MAKRNPLYVQDQPGGGAVVVDMNSGTGNQWYVDSGNTTNGGDTTSHGLTPDAPFLTWDYADSQASANNDDVIHMMAGHAETIITATALTLATAGVKTIGHGTGSDRPTITFTTSVDADCNFDGANLTVRNVLFVNGIDSQVSMLDFNSTDTWLDGCELRQGSAIAPLVGIDINGGAANACDRFKLTDNIINIPTAGVCNGGIELGEVADGGIIAGNDIRGDFDDAGIHNPTGKVLTNLTIKDNRVANLLTGQHAIELVSACTGMLSDNRLYSDGITTMLDPGSMKCNNNIGTDAVDQCGVRLPGTSADAFPDGSIDANVLGADCITAAKVAAGTIDAATFAADAIDAAAIASAAIVGASIDNTFVTKSILGVTVTRALAAIPQTGASALFTVSGGLVIVTSIVGEVTTAVGNVANATKLVANPTTGTTNDLCGTLDIDNSEIGALFGITGLKTDAMVGAVDPGVSGSTVIPYQRPAVAPGTIDIDCAGSDGGGGRVQWTLTYIPLESGSTVAAA